MLEISENGMVDSEEARRVSKKMQKLLNRHLGSEGDMLNLLFGMLSVHMAEYVSRLVTDEEREAAKLALQAKMAGLISLIDISADKQKDDIFDYEKNMGRTIAQSLAKKYSGLYR